MSRLDDTASILTQQNGRKTLIQKISLTTSGVRTNLNTSTLSGAMYGAAQIPVAPGAQLMLQADQDFYYNPCPAGATTAVTNHAGANPGTRVLQYQQEFVTLKGDGATPPLLTDFALDLLGVAAGNLSVFLVE